MSFGRRALRAWKSRVVALETFDASLRRVASGVDVARRSSLISGVVSAWRASCAARLAARSDALRKLEARRRRALHRRSLLAWIDAARRSKAHAVFDARAGAYRTRMVLKRTVSAWWMSSRLWLVHVAARTRAANHRDAKVLAHAMKAMVAATAEGRIVRVTEAAAIAAAEAAEDEETRGHSRAARHLRHRATSRTFSAWRASSRVHAYHEAAMRRAVSFDTLKTLRRHVQPWAKRAREAIAETADRYRADQHALKRVVRRGFTAWTRGVAVARVEARSELYAEVHCRRHLRWKARMAFKIWRVMMRGATYRFNVERAEEERADAWRRTVLARRWSRRWIAETAARRGAAARERLAELHCRRRYLGKLRTRCFHSWWRRGVVLERKLEAIRERSIDRRLVMMMRGWRENAAVAPGLRAQWEARVAAEAAAETAAENRATKRAKRIAARRFTEIFINWHDVASFQARRRLLTTRMVRRHILAATARAAREWAATASAAAVTRDVAESRVAAKHRRRILTLVLVDGWRAHVAYVRETVAAVGDTVAHRHTRAREKAMCTWKNLAAERRRKNGVADVSLRALERRLYTAILRQWHDVMVNGRRVRTLVEHHAERRAVASVCSALKAWRAITAARVADRSLAVAWTTSKVRRRYFTLALSAWTTRCQNVRKSALLLWEVKDKRRKDTVAAFIRNWRSLAAESRAESRRVGGASRRWDSWRVERVLRSWAAHAAETVRI